MTVTQSLNNVTQSGTSQVIDLNAEAIGMTGGQTYCVIIGFVFMVCFALALIYLLIKTFINKSCAGCNRLRNCEKEIVNMKKQMSINGYIDGDSIKEILEQVKELRQEVTTKWKD